MTHAADNAAMIAAAIGNEGAVGQAFNCATSTLVSYDELVGLCASAAGKKATIVHYDPKVRDKRASQPARISLRQEIARAARKQALSSTHAHPDGRHQAVSKYAHIHATKQSVSTPTLTPTLDPIQGFEKPEDFSFKFPFRDTPFYVSADKATDLLGFAPKHTIAQDIAWYYQDNYVAKGLLDKEVSFADDAVVLAAKL